jgi:uncharacterized membrane protein (UPF0127 family)
MLKHVLLQNCAAPLEQPIKVAYCDSFFCRLAGLMFKPSLETQAGLLMVQTTEDRINAAIHMLFMNFDITVVWMDHNLKVVDIKLARKWRPAYTPARAAKYVLEIHPDHFTNFHIGDQVEIKPCGN